MEHIFKLILKNFKSYRDQTLVFHPGINIIKGEGLSGKTNIFRALKLLSNYSAKKNIKWRFALKRDPVHVELITAEKNRIGFVKKNQVKFNLTTKDQDLEFRKIGQSTPEEVKNVLMLDEINFQSQLDLPFIVLNSESKMTKIINAITGIDRVDAYIKQLRNESRDLKSMIQNEERATVGFIKRREKFKILTDVKWHLNKAKEYIKQQEEIQRNIKILIDYVSDFISAEDKIESLEKSKLAQIEVKLAEKYDIEINSLFDKIDYLENVIEELDESKNRIKKLTEQHKVNLKKYMDELRAKKACPVCTSPITPQKIIQIKRSLKNEIHID